MKQQKTINHKIALALLLLPAAVLTAGCSGDDATQAEPAGPETITLTAGMDDGSAQTRGGQDVQTETFDVGEQILVECTPAGGTLQSVVYQTGAVTDGRNALTPYSRALTWPATGTVDLRAYYPSSVSSSLTTFSVQPDQSAADNSAYKQSDLMYAAASGQAKVPSVPLTFHHALSKIVINLVAGDGVTAADLTTCTVAVKACRTVTIANGVADANTATSADWIPIGTGAQLAGIIVPQRIDGSSTRQQFVRVTMGGTLLYYYLTTDKTFAAEKKYTYSLRVSMGGISLETVRINDWDGNDGANTTSPDPLEI